jgi:hypothetical protein
MKRDEKLQPSIARPQHRLLTSGLPRAAQLPPLFALPPLNAHKAVPARVSIDLDKLMAASKLPHRQQHLLEGDATLSVLKLLAHQPGSVRLRPRPLARIVQALSSGGMAILVGGVIAAATAGYFVFASGPPERDSADVRTGASGETSITAGTEVEYEYKLTKNPIEVPPAQVTATEHMTSGDTNAMPGATSLDRGFPGGGAAITAALQDTKPLVGKDSQFSAEAAHDSTCFATASEVRQSHPEAWPSWTLRSPGHQGTKCWYAATRATAHDHRGEMASQKQAVETPETFGSPP